MTAHDRLDFQRLQLVREAARSKSVSFSVHYNESSDGWYGVVSSAAPAEETVTKDGSFDATVDRLLDWMHQL